MQDLHVSGKIELGNSRVVGAIASVSLGTIRNCWVSADVSSTHYDLFDDADIGGIVGINLKEERGRLERSGQILYCCMTGNVSNPKNYAVGGIAGYSDSKIDHVTFYGTRTNNHDEDNLWVGKSAGQLTHRLRLRRFLSHHQRHSILLRIRWICRIRHAGLHPQLYREAQLRGRGHG